MLKHTCEDSVSVWRLAIWKFEAVNGLKKFQAVDVSARIPEMMSQFCHWNESGIGPRWMVLSCRYGMTSPRSSPNSWSEKQKWVKCFNLKLEVSPYITLPATGDIPRAYQKLFSKTVMSSILRESREQLECIADRKSNTYNLTLEWPWPSLWPYDHLAK